MIHLFPKLKKRLIILVAIFLALIIAYLALNPGQNPLIILAIELLLLVFVIISQYLTAAAAHSQMTSRLYNQLDAEGFLRDYLPLLEPSNKKQNLALMVRVHISNAYCALGRFDDAIALLSSVSVKPGKSEEDALLAHFVITSNLCYCALQKEDVEMAKRTLDELLGFKKKLEALQQSKPPKKRMVFYTGLNEQCASLLTTGKADVNALRELIKSDTQPLHRVTVSLWTARAYLAANNRREAEALLEQVVKLAPDLYPGKAAARLLAGLPAKKEGSL